MFELLDYQAPDGTIPLKTWLAGLADRIAKAKIVARVQRVASGNFGDHKPLTDGVWELRVDQGPGYRVYYALAGKQVVLLLMGGDKRRQQADIETAVDYWKDWQKRNAK